MDCFCDRYMSRGLKSCKLYDAAAAADDDDDRITYEGINKIISFQNIALDMNSRNVT